MKELIIVRHAKSDWGEASLDDHDRPLSRRGERNAPQMATLLAEKLKTEDAGVDALISSSALRARTTAAHFARGLGFPEAEVEITQSGYLASAGEWMKLIAAADESVGRLMIFGHNPGLETLANALLREGEGIDHLATCTVVRIALDVDFWGSVDLGTGRLVECLKPREVL